MVFLNVTEELADLRQVLSSLVRVGKVVALLPEKGAVRVEFADLTANDRPLVSAELQVIYSKTHADKEYFLPDLGEQVVCLFLPGGLQTGFVLGSVYSRADSVPVADPDKRHWTFKDGTEIEYDRKTHVLKADVRGDVVVRADKSVEATAGTDITAEAGGNITATAGVGVQITAGAPVTVTAPAVSIGCPTTVTGPVMATGLEVAPGGGGSGGSGGGTITGDFEVEGNITVNGNITATGNIMAGGASDNHHTHPEYA